MCRKPPTLSNPCGVLSALIRESHISFRYGTIERCVCVIRIRHFFYPKKIGQPFCWADRRERLSTDTVRVHACACTPGKLFHNAQFACSNFIIGTETNGVQSCRKVGAVECEHVVLFNVKCSEYASGTVNQAYFHT